MFLSWGHYGCGGFKRKPPWIKPLFFVWGGGLVLFFFLFLGLLFLLGLLLFARAGPLVGWLVGWLGWVGLGWVGLGWVGLGWVGLGWVGLVCLGWVWLGLVGFGWV